jgi:hypothetical protein
MLELCIVNAVGSGIKKTVCTLIKIKILLCRLEAMHRLYFNLLQRGSGQCLPHPVDSNGVTCPSGEVQWTILKGVDIPGSDITNVGGHSIATCQQLCLATSGCMSAVLASDGSGMCWVKNTVPAQSISDVRISMTFTCCAGKCAKKEGKQCFIVCMILRNCTNTIFDIMKVTCFTDIIISYAIIIIKNIIIKAFRWLVTEITSKIG